MNKQHKGKIVCKVGEFSVIDCDVCGFKHIDPIPGDDELKKRYRNNFYKKEKVNYFKDAEEDLAWWTLTYREYYKLLSQYVEGKMLLDIGSGPGYFLKIGKELGWSVTGLEPSADAYHYSSSLGLDVINAPFDTGIIKQLDKYDVVSMNYVLEHISEPIKFIQSIKAVLKKDGLLFLVFPNDFNPLQNILWQKMGFKPWWVVPEHHINYFDLESITSLLKKQGFKLRAYSGTYPMETFLLSDHNYIDNRRLGRICHRWRKEFEINLYKHAPALLRELYTDLAKRGIGRAVVVIAQK